MITTAQAIHSLRPNTEWTMNGDDVENIIWHTPNVEPLTQQEVEAEIQRLQELQENEAVQKEATRQAAINHAKSLGFTDDMIAIMYPTLS